MEKARELRVERRPRSIHTARRHEGWRHERADGVWLERSEDGRVGDFTPEMVEFLKEHAAEMRSGFFHVPNMFDHIADAVERVLKEAGE